jgi:hypothetical protein
MTLDLITDRTPIADKETGFPSMDQGHMYCFRVMVGGTIFATPWFYGDDEQEAEHAERCQQAFKDTDSVEVVR